LGLNCNFNRGPGAGRAQGLSNSGTNELPGLKTLHEISQEAAIRLSSLSYIYLKIRAYQAMINEITIVTFQSRPNEFYFSFLFNPVESRLAEVYKAFLLLRWRFRYIRGREEDA
jgi:hypothetical protein